MAITKSDGTIITSTEDIGHEYVAFFTSLLGTEAPTNPVDNNVFEWGPKLSSEQAQWVNGVYLKGNSIWEWRPKRGDSPLFQRLSQIHDIIVGVVGSPQAAKQLFETWASSKGLDTSKAYEYFKPKQARQPWQAMIWQAFIPPKFTFILWLGIRERLSTRDRLTFLHEETSCSLCINRSESAKHLFFNCPFSERVWSEIRRWLGINRRMSTILSAIKWLKKEKTSFSVQNKARLLALECTVYSLWRHCNEVVFEAKAPSTEGLVISIKIIVFRILLSLFPQGTFAL
ncbi:hypothetical protein Salat_2637200 [Sesamum alatum]|uniref:Reverse transcriptase zinc-binding domain-containing protein n=1 Tax=Sesamum alatum TaxID=300844 RepID=A0AAE1XNX7_9LAMI|nr:hypothetical protein Salat_2637200 [Sesamum alatum]